MRGWRLFSRRLSPRFFSSTTASPDNNAFAHTVRLPQTTFPLRRDPNKEELLRKRTCEDLYHQQWAQTDRPLFVFHDGPPYANGDLHMGHALNKILKDIINRFHLSIGERVHYVPGWDCHGLPIENKVLKSIGKDVHEVSAMTIRKEAEVYAKQQVASQQELFKQFGIMSGWSDDTTYRTLDHDYEMRQLSVFQEMVKKGMIYRHFRPVHYSPSSHSALAEAELEYKDNHVSHSVYVSFDLDVARKDAMHPALRTLAENQTRVQLLVWTTTPWTLTANMAIAVNPEMRYTVMQDQQHPDAGVVIFATSRREHLQDVMDSMGLNNVVAELQGSNISNAFYRPLFAQLSGSTISLPILPSPHVTPDAGTGLVHCAPAHGQEDYALFRALGLVDTTSPSALVCHVDGTGKFTPQVAEVLGTDAGALLRDKEVLYAGGKIMVKLLDDMGVLRKTEKIKHRYPYDWKTDQPVIILATSQWFANLDAIKDDAIVSLQDVQFYPAQSRNRLEAFIKSRSEWCISRQRVWGVPIPALHHLPTGKAVLDADSLDHILPILRERGVQHWWDAPVEEFVPPAQRVPGEDIASAWVKGTDTMDVWFDSGTSWAMLNQLRGEKRKGQHLADVCLEGSDQHRGWFQSQLLTAIGVGHGREGADARPMAPYGTLITHGMVLDEKGRKMSKSLGNIMSPRKILYGGEDLKEAPAYGLEVLRLWAATVESGKDTPIGKTVLVQCLQTQRKIRNTARFILGTLRDASQPVTERVKREDMGLLDRYAMHKLRELDAIARTAYTAYNLPRVVSELSNFVKLTLSSFYLDVIKDRLYVDKLDNPSRRASITVLEQILDITTHVMTPILPQLAQEIRETMKDADRNDTQSPLLTPWKPLSPEWNDPQAETDMNALIRVRDAVLVLLEQPRKAKLLKSSLEAEVDLILPDGVPENSPLLDILRREESFLKELFIVSGVSLTDEGSLGVSSPVWVYTGSVPLNGASAQEIGIRVRPATLHKCPRCWAYTRDENDTLCKRCSDVVESFPSGS